MIEWILTRCEFANCNCAHGCPCQFNALPKIMQDQETKPMATKRSVNTAMCSTILEPMFKPIELDIDVENRTGEVVVPSVFKTKGEPVGNLVTCDIRRARMDLPNGFEHEIAEIDSGTTKATGKIELNLENSYVQFAGLRLSNRGIIDKAA